MVGAIARGVSLEEGYFGGAASGSAKYRNWLMGGL